MGFNDWVNYVAFDNPISRTVTSVVLVRPILYCYIHNMIFTNFRNRKKFRYPQT